MKLAVIGGGGFRVPLIYRSIARDELIDQVALYDPSAERLRVIGSILTEQQAALPTAPIWQPFTDLEPALRGSDFVFVAIRVGGLDGRIGDERIALGLGVLGQETTGPGGIAYGLRSVPAALRIADAVRRICPDAYVINFTNPAGIVTEAMSRVLGDRVVGVCDSPRALGRRVAALLGLPADDLEFDYIGLNHLGWLRRTVHHGTDRLPDLLADDRADALIEARLFGREWLQALGAIPNEYLYYYYCNREAVRSLIRQPETRGQVLRRQQHGFYAAATAHPGQALRLWDNARQQRATTYLAAEQGDPAPAATETGGYESVARDVIAAIAYDRPTTMILDVRNRGAIPGFDDDAVVEIPCTVDSGGARPLPLAPPDLHQSGLMQQVKAVERLTIEAAVTGAPGQALKAFALHPLTQSISTARELLRGYPRGGPEAAANGAWTPAAGIPGE